MTRIISLLALAPLLALATPSAAETPRVVADIAPTHSIVARVMQGVGTPTLLLDAATSPHDAALRPSQARALQESGLVVFVSHDLTPWLDRPLETLATGAAHLELIEAGGTIRLATRELPIMGEPAAADQDHGHDDHGQDEHGHEEHDKHGHDDHEHDHAREHDDHGHEKGHDKADDHAQAHDGHAHGDTDPHAWLDLRNAAAWADAIAAALSDLDPVNAETYRANAAAFAAEMQGLEADLSAQLAPYGDIRFLSVHDAFQYFENRFGLNSAGALSLSDAVPPGPARLAAIRALASGGTVTCLFTEPQLSDRLIRTVTEDTGLGIAVLDPLGLDLDPGPALYPALMTRMAGAVADCAG